MKNICFYNCKRENRCNVIIIIVLFFVYGSISIAGEIEELVIVKKNKAILYVTPNIDEENKRNRKASIGLQLQILKVTDDNKWYQVKIGEDKGYQFDHNKNFWIKAEDVYEEYSKPEVTIELDFNLYNNNDFSVKYDNSSPILSTQPPINMGVSIGLNNYPAKKEKYDKLYKNGLFKVSYKLKSEKQILSITESLIVTNIVMKSASCYPRNYVGTEIKTINKVKHNNIDKNIFSSSSNIKPNDIFGSSEKFMGDFRFRERAKCMI